MNESAGPSSDKRSSYYEELLRHPDSQQPGFDRLSCSVLLNLLLTTDAVQSVLGRALAAHGVSTSAYNVLRILRRSGPDGRPLHEIGELLVTSRANVTGLVDCLEAKGLVHRFPDPIDRRSRRARLTEDGAALLSSVTPGHFQRMRELADGLPDAEKQTLAMLLGRLREHVYGYGTPEPVGPSPCPDPTIDCSGDYHG